MNDNTDNLLQSSNIQQDIPQVRDKDDDFVRSPERLSNTQKDQDPNIGVSEEDDAFSRVHPELQSEQQSFLKSGPQEAHGCIEVVGLESWQDKFKDKKPVDVYLQMCKEFNSVNLNKDQIYLSEYKFSKDDFFDENEKPKSPQVLSPEVVGQQVTVEPQLIPRQFKNDFFRHFSNIVFVQKQQMLLVKTWQKTRYTEYSPDQEDSDSEEDNGGGKPSQNGQKQGQDNMTKGDGGEEALVKKTGHLWIKSLKVFDIENREKKDILLEHVDGDLDRFRLYDSSFIQFEEWIFYYKRIRPADKPSQLKLFKYNLLTFQEEVMADSFAIEEPTGIQFNVIFGERFGVKSNQSFKTQKEFLESQFISLQPYIHDWEEQSCQIISLKGMKKIVSGVDKPGEIPKKRQVQHFCFIQGYCDEGPETINFILIDMIETLNVQFDLSGGKIIKHQVYRNTDSFMKILNPNVQPQVVLLKVYDENDKVQKILQYFFLDAANQIQLLYPNYSQKVERHKYIEHIGEQCQIDRKDGKYFKKITYLTNETQRGATMGTCFNKAGDAVREEDFVQCSKINCIQDISHLQMILDKESILQAQVLTFCEDPEESILYIVQATTRTIEWIYLKDHHCEDCFSESSQKKEEVKTNLVQNSIQNVLAQWIQRAKGRSILSRRKNNVNMLQTSLSKAYSELVGAEKSRPTLNYEIKMQDQFSKMIVQQMSMRVPQTNTSKIGININSGILDKMKDKFRRNTLPELTSEECKNHIHVLDQRNNLIKIKSHSLSPEKMERMMLLHYMRTSMHYLFVFQVNNSEGAQQMSSYIFVRKTMEEMQKIFTGNILFTTLIDDYAEVLLLRSPTLLEPLFFESVQDHQLSAEYKEIQISFCIVNDQNQMQNFIPFTYQEKGNHSKNQLVTFDIFRNSLSCQTRLTPAENMAQYIYENDGGWNKLQLCRTSDVYEKNAFEWYSNRGGLPRDMKLQKVKFQVFTLFNEKLGAITAQEFLLSYELKGPRIQKIGEKLLLMSRKLIQESDWASVRQSQPVPFYDISGKVKGCQYILKTSHAKVGSGKVAVHAVLNLLDQDINNLYTYESRVAQIGKKKFELKKGDRDAFVVVISTCLRQHLIDHELLDRSEVHYVLSYLQHLILQEKTPDLGYMVLRDFNELKRTDFFRSQEYLHGQSICDICLSDPNAIKLALGLDLKTIASLDGSLAVRISKGDQVRREAFRQLKFLEPTLLISQDYSYVSTIERGLVLNAVLSVKILLRHIFQEVNTTSYSRYIMLDLPCILSQKKLNINEFFERSHAELLEREKEGFCNMETPFEEDLLPVFSDKPQEYLRKGKFNNFHDFEGELVSQILQRDAQKGPDTERNIEVEHQFIDFQDLQIGEKLRKCGLAIDQKLRFDDLYYARLLASNPENREFFEKESAQKLIDFQFLRTKKVFVILFTCYFLAFCCPFVFMVFGDGLGLTLAMGRICLVCQIVFFGIELIQIKHLGLEYFMGWNIIDFSQFWLYIFYYYAKFGDAGEDIESFLPHIQYGIIVLASCKILFFVRIFQDYGFLVQMILLTLGDLVPFLIGFIVALIFFALCFCVLGTGIEEEIQDVSGPGFNGLFGFWFLQVYRISLGEIGVPQYDDIASREQSWSRDTHIVLIWLTWLSITFMNVIILLNFLIAVISQTYEKVTDSKNITEYEHKADLNEECYQLLSVFTKLQQYKAVSFSYSKDIYNHMDQEEDDRKEALLLNKIQKIILSQKQDGGAFNNQNVLEGKVDLLQNQMQKMQQEQDKFFAEIKKMLKK